MAAVAAVCMNLRRDTENFWFFIVKVVNIIKVNLFQVAPAEIDLKYLSSISVIFQDLINLISG